MKKRWIIRVNGKVQGVFFRASTSAKATQLAIKGFVRNEPDGSVYIDAEADKDVLAEFLSWCKEGPPAANVASCEVEEVELIMHYDAFEVQR